MRLKTEVHHWWPRSLSQFWTCSDGYVKRLSPDGTVVASPPANFGAIKNAHHIKLGDGENVWNSSFEASFNEPDNHFPAIAQWLRSLEPKAIGNSRAAFHKRFVAHPLSAERRGQLALCLASLIVRSPGFKNLIKLTVEDTRKHFGIKAFQADKSLIAANIPACYEQCGRTLSSSGKFAILHSRSKKFIFGDGFLHNFRPFPTPPINPRCIVPLLPSVTVIFTRPMAYRGSSLVTVTLRDDEVEAFNNIVQVYSQDSLFYKAQRLSVASSFAAREFLQLEYHTDRWLDYLLDEIAGFAPIKAQR